MTDSNYAHIHIDADCSSSMAEWAGKETKATAATRGIHELVRRQREFPGKTTFSLTEFDTTLTKVAEFSDGSLLAGWACHPRGMTALLDAVGDGITATGAALEKLPEDQRPGKVYFVISTDGQENSSVKYGLEQIRQMIRHQQDVYGWEFIYIGVGPEAYAGGTDMGVQPDAILLAAADMGAQTYAASSSAIHRSRVSGQPVSYSDEEREEVSSQ
jgi:hypothetical protein